MARGGGAARRGGGRGGLFRGRTQVPGGVVPSPLVLQSDPGFGELFSSNDNASGSGGPLGDEIGAQDGFGDTGDGALGSIGEASVGEDFDTIKPSGMRADALVQGPDPLAGFASIDPPNFLRLVPHGDAGHPAAEDWNDGWQIISTPGPAVLIPRGQVTRYPVCFAPANNKPRARRDAQRSRGQGVVHIPAAGDWILKLDTFYSGETFGAVDYLQLDARSPWVGSRALQDLESSSIVLQNEKTGAVQTVPVGNVVQVLDDDPYRTALALSIVGTSGYAFVGFDTAPTATSGIFVPTSVAGTPQPLYLGDSFAWKGKVQVYAVTADQLVTTFSWID